MDLYGKQTRDNTGNITGQRNASTIEHTQNIRAGIPIAKTRYGLTIDDYDYIDLAVDFLRDVRHFGATDYYAVLRSDEQGDVTLPCNLHTIDAVTTDRMGVNKFGDRILYTNDNDMAIHTDNVIEPTDMTVDFMNFYNELYYWPDQTSSTRAGEGYITYRFKDARTINVKAPTTIIVVAYSGLTTDSEGYPLITRKQANGIAASILLQQTTKKALRGDQAAANMLAFAKEESGRLKQAASIPEDINDNEIDEILNAKTAFNRKNFGRPSKHGR